LKNEKNKVIKELAHVTENIQ